MGEWKPHVNHWPLANGRHDATSPVVGELERRGIRFEPTSAGWVRELAFHNDLTLWPGADGKWGMAIGHQYAAREGGGFRHDWDGLMSRLGRLATKAG